MERSSANGFRSTRCIEQKLAAHNLDLSRRRGNEDGDGLSFHHTDYSVVVFSPRTDNEESDGESPSSISSRRRHKTRDGNLGMRSSVQPIYL